MSDRYYTLMIVPERGTQVRQWTIPRWTLRFGALAGIIAIAGLSILTIDYWYVLGQIGENRELRFEARKLKQQLEIYEQRVQNMERTLDRVQTFATRLKIITNLDDTAQTLTSQLDTLPIPDADQNIGSLKNPDEDPALAEKKQETEERFGVLQETAFKVESLLQDLTELLVDQRAFLAALPTIRPARGYFTSGFGIRRSPYGGQDKMHEGLDIANPIGTPIHAPADGTVAFSGIKPGYGRTVIVDHGYGLETWFGHSSQILVNSGKKVRRGEKLALMGSSGRSTGPHLHYEVRIHGIPVDPLSYILED